MKLNISVPSSDTLKAWAERADDAWDTLQGFLAPYDATVARWVSLWTDDLPPMADGLLTLMAIPVALVGGLVVFTLFDMSGTLLQRITFGYRARRPMAPVYFKAYTALQQTVPNVAVLPLTRLIDIVAMKNGSRYQRAKHWYRLAAHKADAVICHPETLAPLGVVLWVPNGNIGRYEKRRQRRIKQLCKKARLLTWQVAVNSKGVITLNEAVRRDISLMSHTPTPMTPSIPEVPLAEPREAIQESVGGGRSEPTLGRVVAGAQHDEKPKASLGGESKDQKKPLSEG